MYTQVYSIEDIKVKLKPVFEKYGLIKAAVFGSYARHEAMPDSDVDLLVYLDESFELEKYLKFETALKRALKKKIDIVEYRCINGFMREDILKEAVTLYDHQGQETPSYNN
jgi:uncharacterized protein